MTRTRTESIVELERLIEIMSERSSAKRDKNLKASIVDGTIALDITKLGRAQPNAYLYIRLRCDFKC